MGTELQDALRQFAKSAAAAGLEKRAVGLLDKVMTSSLRPGGLLWPIVAGGGLGALMGGEDNRAEGAIAGIIGGAIGRGLLAPQGRRFAGTLVPANAEELRIIREGGSALEKLRRNKTTLDAALRNSEALTGEVGRAGGALGGGYALRAKKDYDRSHGMTEPQQVMYDLGGQYTGFLPGELNDADLLGL